MKIALEMAIEKYQKSVFAAAFSVCKNTDDANDIVQDTFLKYNLCDKEFQTEEHIKAWLLRVAINKSRNLVKSFWSRRTIGFEEWMETIPVEYEEEKNILDAVCKLQEKYRAVIHLYYYEDMSASEISSILHISESAVNKRLSRGRTMLKDILKEE